MKDMDLHLKLFALAGAFLCLAFITSGGNDGFDALTLWSQVNTVLCVVCFAGGLVVYIVKIIREWRR